jgi:uncharacterized protein YjbJ (UPF0337 family)
MNKDHIEGAFSEAKGTIKEAAGDMTGDARTEASGKIDELTGRAQQAWGDARDTIDGVAADASETLSDAAARASSTIRDKAETVKATASQVGSKVYEAGATAGHTIASTVKEQPLLTLIGVAAIGYLAGYLLHSPSSPFAPEPEPRYRRAIRRWS